jgi:hypothetical protein
MKKRDKEELVSKSVIFTVIILVIMFCTSLINKGASTPDVCLVVRSMTTILSVAFLLVAIVFLIAGFKKNEKFFCVSAWAAGLATFSMLMRISYWIKPIQIKLPRDFFVYPNTTITFYMMAIAAMVLAIVAIWVRTAIKIIKK